MELGVNEKITQNKANLSNMELYFAIGTCLPFLASSFITFLITDRTSHMKSMQHVAGISIWMYWIVNFVWDYITYCVITTIFSLPIFKLHVDGFGTKEFFLMYCVILAFGICALPLVYCLSLIFSNETVGYLATVAIFTVTGSFNFLIEMGLFRGGGMVYSKMAIMFPQLCVFRAISNIHFIGLKKLYCLQEAEYLNVSDSYICYLDTNNECCGRLFLVVLFLIYSFPIPERTNEQLYWNWDYYGLNQALTSMSINALLCFVILFLHEYIVIVWKLTPTNLVKLYSYLLPAVDPMLRKRKMEISELTPLEKQSYRVVIDGLEGEVSKHSNLFRTISLVLEEQKCFGIIGHLNAGNVDLCRKIAGLDKFVLGEVTINGFDMSTQRTDAQKHLSVSIQNNKISCSMSAYEYLEVLCYCRGVRGARIRSILLEIFDMLFMRKVMYHSISSFDQSYIKKLSIASALVGNISVMIIDQPTASIDPISKIAIWNAILFARSIGRTIIFSSDSLSEADRLSDEMMFLLEGNVVGLASPTEIRIKSCKGFYIEFRMALEGKTMAEIEEKYEVLELVFCA